MERDRTSVEIRRAGPDDERAVLALAGAALGWADDERDATFFKWKHHANPFGTSPMWVAESGGRLVGFRTFLRWEFEAPGNARLRAVRAVDTATHPDFQGQGIFTRLTKAALAELADEGIDFVFNTPNAQSRPGYLKMGWVEVGPLPLRTRLGTLRSVPKLRDARAPAEKWSLSTDAGSDALTALGELSALEELLSTEPPPTGVRTRRDVAFFQWRYSFAPLRYRALVHPDGVAAGVAFFRLRQRGPIREAVLCEILTPDGDRRCARSLARRVVREARADTLVWLDLPEWPLRGIPLKRFGPILTWRAVTLPEQPESWRLRLGDVELF